MIRIAWVKPYTGRESARQCLLAGCSAFSRLFVKQYAPKWEEEKRGSTGKAFRCPSSSWPNSPPSSRPRAPRANRGAGLGPSSSSSSSSSSSASVKSAAALLPGSRDGDAAEIELGRRTFGSATRRVPRRGRRSSVENMAWRRRSGAGARHGFPRGPQPCLCRY